MFWRALIIFILPLSALAQVEITEIMYDVPGSDDGREWLEIKNIGAEPLDLSTWKFFEEGAAHGLSAYQGGLLLSSDAFAVIVKDPGKFLTDWPSFSGILIDSSWSTFSQTGEALAMKNGDLVVGEVSYSPDLGAAGDGNSLQKNGSGFVPAGPTPGTANSTTPVVDQNNVSSTGDSAETPSSSGGNSAPVESKIKTNISGPSSGIAGVDVYFKAITTGIAGEPLQNARHVWSFGDGATAEGESVVHTYVFPGDYTVALEASSEKYSAGSRLRIKISEPQVVFKQVVPGKDGYLEFTNNAPAELDLSYWQIRSGGFYFVFPKNTLISARSSVIFPNSVLKLEIVPSDTYLLYPSGFVVIKYEEPPAPKMMIEIPQTAPPAAASVKNPPAAAKEGTAPAVKDDLSIKPATLPATATLAAAAIPITSPKNQNPLIWYGMLISIIVIAYLGYIFLAKKDPKIETAGPFQVEVQGQKYVIIEEKSD